MVHRVTTNDNEWQQVVQRETTSDNEWQQVVQRVVQWVRKSDNEWCNEWQRVVQRVTMNDNKWQQVTKSDNKWQLVTASASSGTTNENGTVHFKEWMIAILSMTKTDTLLLQGMDGCN